MLSPKRAYVFVLSDDYDGTKDVEHRAELIANPAGAAIVNALGPFRQVTQGIGQAQPRHY